MRASFPGIKALIALICIAFLLPACTTSTPQPPHYGSTDTISPQRRAHQERQARRYEEGGYRRLYRPRDCRQGDAACGDGFPVMGR